MAAANTTEKEATTHMEDVPIEQQDLKSEAIVGYVEKLQHEAQVNENLDKFGASAKTDPREIALVRKLDWYIMVRQTHSCP